MVEPSDEQLLAELKSNPKAFRLLYDRYAGLLLRFTFRFTANQQSAEEVLHDVFLEMLNGNFKSFAEGGLKAWLFTVAKNKSLNLQRRRNHELKALDSEQLVDPTDLELKINQRLLHGKLAVLEKDLPADLLETWTLRRQGFDNQQIAEQLAIPLGTVKSRFHRLVAHLIKEFDR